MNDLQRKLWLAWIEADRKVSHLIGSKPEDSIDGWLEWRADFHEAIGHRDGMRAACVLAEVPNFEE